MALVVACCLPRHTPGQAWLPQSKVCHLLPEGDVISHTAARRLFRASICCARPLEPQEITTQGTRRGQAWEGPGPRAGQSVQGRVYKKWETQWQSQLHQEVGAVPTTQCLSDIGGLSVL